jgi:hypothetical protein
VTDPQDALIAQIAKFKHDPLGFVLFAFPWGEKSGDLSAHTGPRTWQREYLADLGETLKANPHTPIRLATCSGHGIGKSALIAFLTFWALSTKRDTKVVITANTEPQLRTKLWPELAKWHRMLINSHWWKLNGTSIHSLSPKHEGTWRADGLTWTENNTEAFAGLHNEGKRLLIVMDEASAIHDKVWEVTSGALSDANTEIIWPVFGNGTRNTGAFRECFGSQSHRWKNRQIDSRTVEGVNLKELAEEVATYGEDSDRVRVRIKGQFPRSGSLQFISSEDVANATRARLEYSAYDVTVIGVDVARFGDDHSVIRVRRGKDARTIAPKRFHGVDTMQLVGHVTSQIAELTRVGWGCDAVFVDETGVGGGVVDRLRQLGYKCIGVNNGAKSDTPVNGELVANKGAECWARGREWLRTGGGIAETDRELLAQLEGREYGYNAQNEIVLEKKSDMKKRGLASPDDADALFLTMAYPIVKQSVMNAGGHPAQMQAQSEYNPFDALK